MSDLGVRFTVPVTIERQYSYAMVRFGCGRVYSGAQEIVGPAIKRHEQSGCKRCRRYQRRMDAIRRKMLDVMAQLYFRGICT